MWAITQFTLMKMREFAFYMLLLVAVIVCILSNVSDPISEQVTRGSLFSYAFSSGAAAVPPISMGTCVALVVSILISTFYAATEIPTDISNGVIMVILAKPVGRFRYLAGKFIAVSIMAYVIFIVLQIMMFLASRFLGIGVLPYNSFEMALRQLMPAMLLLPMIAMTISFSISTGALGAMIFTGFYLILSVLIAVIPLTLALFPAGMAPGMDLFFFMIHYFFLNPLFYFHDAAANVGTFFYLLAYSFSFAAIFLMLAAHQLSAKDIGYDK